jgi:hypothetical protein
MKDHPTCGDIARWLRLVVEAGDVIELRILGVVDNPRYPAFTVSGYFAHDHLDELARFAMEWTGKADGCYITINPVVPDLLARAANRIVKRPKHATGDGEIVRRAGLVFDTDPKRPAGVSATDAEKVLARERIDQVVAELARRRWPVPILADSGNGYHARYAIDLPNDDQAHDLVKRVLKAADAKFSDDRVHIDTKLGNASRIIKLYGTMARKGDHTEDRPHRWSQVLSVPEQLTVVPVELLEAFAAAHQPVKPRPRANSQPGGAPRSTPGLSGLTNPEGRIPPGQPGGAPRSIPGRDGASPEARASAYVFAHGFPDPIEGEHGHDRLYHVACVLVDGFGLDRVQALPIFRDWNQVKAQPPELENQIQHKLDDAIKNHPVPSLKLLNADRDAVMHREHGPTPSVHLQQESDTHGAGSGTHGLVYQAMCITSLKHVYQGGGRLNHVYHRPPLSHVYHPFPKTFRGSCPSMRVSGTPPGGRKPSSSSAGSLIRSPRTGLGTWRRERQSPPIGSRSVEGTA